MSTLLPYDVNREDNTYKFNTENGIIYNVIFSDGSFYFSNLPSHIPVYEITIKFVSLGKYFTPPKDSRAEITIIEVIRAFLGTHTNSLLYTCDNTDDKHHVRNRKFNMWFNRFQNSQLEKYDAAFTVADIEILSSLIIHSQNPNRERLIQIFNEQAKAYEKNE
jgi:Family of unknown function (DUF6169)